MGGSFGGLCGINLYDAPCGNGDHPGEKSPLPLMPSSAGENWLSEDTAGKGGATIGLIHLFIHQQTLSSHHVPGTVLGSGVTMVDMTWSHPDGAHGPRGLEGKQQMAWHLLLDRLFSKLLGKVKGLLPLSLETRRKAKRKTQNTYRRLDASEESASDKTASPGGEFIRLKAGQ